MEFLSWLLWKQSGKMGTAQVMWSDLSVKICISQNIFALIKNTKSTQATTQTPCLIGERTKTRVAVFVQTSAVFEKCQKAKWPKSTNTFHPAALEPNWRFNSFWQRRGGRREADSAACYKPPPSRTCRSHDYPNTVFFFFFPPPKIQPDSLFTLHIFQTIFVIAPRPKRAGLSWQPRGPTWDTSGSSRSGDHLFAAGRDLEPRERKDTGGSRFYICIAFLLPHLCN